MAAEPANPELFSTAGFTSRRLWLAAAQNGTKAHASSTAQQPSRAVVVSRQAATNQSMRFQDQVDIASNLRRMEEFDSTQLV